MKTFEPKLSNFQTVLLICARSVLAKKPRSGRMGLEGGVGGTKSMILPNLVVTLDLTSEI